MVAEAPSIHIKDLTYNFPDGSAALNNINVDLPPGSRTLLIGGMSAALLQRVNCDPGEEEEEEEEEEQEEEEEEA